MKDTVDSFAQTAANQDLHHQIPIDLDLEATDPLAKHEITLQFAAFREINGGGNTGDRNHGSGGGGGGGVQQRGGGRAGRGIGGPAPTSLYFTYQFYTCLPTRTERMLLRPDGPKDRLYQVGAGFWLWWSIRQLLITRSGCVRTRTPLVISSCVFPCICPTRAGVVDQRRYLNTDHHLPTSPPTGGYVLWDFPKASAAALSLVSRPIRRTCSAKRNWSQAEGGDESRLSILVRDGRYGRDEPSLGLRHSIDTTVMQVNLGVKSRGQRSGS